MNLSVIAITNNDDFSLYHQGPKPKAMKTGLLRSGLFFLAWQSEALTTLP